MSSVVALPLAAMRASTRLQGSEMLRRRPAVLGVRRVERRWGSGQFATGSAVNASRACCRVANSIRSFFEVIAHVLQHRVHRDGQPEPHGHVALRPYCRWQGCREIRGSQTDSRGARRLLSNELLCSLLPERLQQTLHDRMLSHSELLGVRVVQSADDGERSQLWFRSKRGSPASTVVPSVFAKATACGVMIVLAAWCPCRHVAGRAISGTTIDAIPESSWAARIRLRVRPDRACDTARASETSPCRPKPLRLLGPVALIDGIC